MTIVNVKTRMREHRSRANTGSSLPVHVWMRDVGIASVEIVELEATTDPEAEVRWIQRLLTEGHPLRNDRSRDGVLNSNGPEWHRKTRTASVGRTSWTKGKTGEAAGWTDERRAAYSQRTPWLKGKTGEAAGWTEERKQAQRERLAARRQAARQE